MPTRRSEVTKSGLTERFLKTFEPVTVGEWLPAGPSEQGCPGSDPWPTEERPGKPSRGAPETQEMSTGINSAAFNQ